MARWIPRHSEGPAGRGPVAPAFAWATAAHADQWAARWGSRRRRVMLGPAPVTTTLLAPLVLALLAAPPAGGDPPASTSATEPAAGEDAAPSPATDGSTGGDEAASPTTESSSRSGRAASSSRSKVPRPRGATAATPEDAAAAPRDAATPPPRRNRWSANANGGARRGLSWSRADEPVPERRFLLGVEGVVMQAPPLRPEVVRFDPRFLGRSVSLGGLGLLGRLQVHPRIGIEAGVRSGSVRYAGRKDEDGPLVSQDQVMADLGVLLYVARGDVARLAFDAGVGGMGTRVVYETDREGRQLYGSGLVRVGADAELLFKRIAFVLSVRSYGVLTDRDRVSQRGALLEGKTLRAPVPALQTFLVASAGIAYRF